MTYRTILQVAALGVPFLTNAALEASENQVFELEPVVVRGDLLHGPLEQLPASVTIISPTEANATGSEHLEDLLGRMPNLNWAGGTSRPRFFQIRGIGENSQFGNEIPASSVGFMVDGIDLTGIGGVAGLFDVDHVEVLRGPQAAAFGANALAGMVIVETASPTSTSNGKAEAAFGDHDLISLGIASGGPVGGSDSTLAYRFSANLYQDNGYRENRFLGRDDTNERDERTARLKLDWAPGDAVEFNLTALYFDFDNGYDAWSLTNDSLVTTTDEPGRDSQETTAIGLRATLHANERLDLSYNGSVSESDSVYSYDWDWSNPAELMELYGPEVYWGTDVTERVRTVWSHDLRLSSPAEAGASLAWAAGAYYRDFEEEQAYFGVNSSYTTETVAAYGQARIAFAEVLSLTVAGRIEDLSIAYADDLGTRMGSSDQPWGGKVALEHALSDTHLVYASIDRGFKAGGVNLDNDVPADFRVYGTETLWNYEFGWRGTLLEERLRLRATAFYMDRQDIQVDSSIQLGDGNTFALFKDNAASGTNYGLEIELDWDVSENLSVFASLGLLQAEFDNYRYIDPANGVSEIVLDGSEQAYAPGYNYAIGADYAFGEGFFAGFTLEGKDSYVFDIVNGQTLASYNLLHLRLGYDHGPWRFTVWAHNVLDEQHEVRGFFFANEPPYYDAPKRWLSHGAPRQMGLSVRRSF
jgi:outer membrane receptor protein involved in Fe transport